MKKLLTILLTLTLLCGCHAALAEYITLLTPPPTAAPDLTLLPSVDEVKAYAEPRIGARIVGYIIVGGRQEVNVLTVQGEWVKVTFTSIHGLTTGWIPRSCFTIAATPTPEPTPSPTPTPGPAPDSAFVCNPQPGYRLNLRTSPTSSATSLGKYYTGTPVTLTGDSRNGYVRVVIGNVTGWMDARYLTDDPLAFRSELPQVYIVNPSGGANLRAGVGTSTARLGWYPHGGQVTVLGIREDEWYHVAVGGKVGYMSSTLLSRTFLWQMGTDSDTPVISGNVAAGGTGLYIGASGAYLRDGASGSARSLGLLYSGCPVTVISYTRTGWTYVRIGELTGYVDSGSLSTVRPHRIGNTRTIINPYGTGLNLRDQPTTGSNILTLCRNHTDVIVLGDLAEDWCYVLVNGQYGFMMGTRLVP